MRLPPGARALIGPETLRAWVDISPVVPPSAYLGGGTAIAIHLEHRESHDLDFFFHRTLDLDRLARRLAERGAFVVTARAAGTLNGLFHGTRVQFLRAGLTTPEHRLERTQTYEGIAVAGLADLLAMKLNAIAGRAQLRDYFDLMVIEQRGGRTVEEGLALFLERYRPEHADSALRPVVLALGYLEDVVDDPGLPVDRATIERYWQMRQPEVIRSLARLI